MRRRQINQLRAAGLIPPVALHERVKWEAEREPQDKPEGHKCPKCGKVLLRKWHVHERTCNADLL